MRKTTQTGLGDYVVGKNFSESLDLPSGSFLCKLVPPKSANQEILFLQESRQPMDVTFAEWVGHFPGNANA